MSETVRIVTIDGQQYELVPAGRMGSNRGQATYYALLPLGESN